MGLIDQMLVKRQDSRLYRKLVAETGIAGEVSGGINNLLGNMFNYNGPMLWRFNFTHDTGQGGEEIKAAVDAVIEDIAPRRCLRRNWHGRGPRCARRSIRRSTGRGGSG